MVTYEYYKYSSPERKFSVRLLDFYATYDSQPISTNASNSDYGVTSSIAYKF
jgi:hypothetical protein